MKKAIVAVIALFCMTQINAQDIITLKSGEKINAKVVDLTETSVVYKLYDDQDGQSYSRKKFNIVSIAYENGNIDIFDPDEVMKDGVTKPEIRKGMSYAELKEIYNPDTYVRRETDQYMPGLMGLCSFIIPGLGQFIEGEVTPGLLMMGVNVGLNLARFSLGDEVVNSNGKKELQLTPKEMQNYVLLTALSIAVGIYSATYATRCAKVKNLYRRDLLNMKNSTSFSLSPSLDLTPSTIGFVPSAGLTASIVF